MSNRMVGLLAMVALVCLVGSAMAQDGQDALRGRVVSVDAEKGTVVVKPREGDNVTVATDKDTKVTLDDKEVKLADLKADMGVRVTPKTGTAKTIAAMTPALRGRVVSVDAEKNTLVVKPYRGDDVTVAADKDTKVTIDGKEAKLADLKAEMSVTVTPEKGTAKTIVVQSPALRGTVVSVNADKGELVVKPRRGDNVTVSTNADTKVTLDDKEAKLADLKADMRVEVTPDKGAAKTIKATTPKPES